VPKIPTAEVSQELLDSLFAEFDLWAKIKDGRLTSQSVAGKDLPSWRWPNATSTIIKHIRPDGKHIATTHCIADIQGQALQDEEGHPIHWHAKDFRMLDVRLILPKDAEASQGSGPPERPA